MADPLRTYLNDHLAGATTGRDLARTLAEGLGGTPAGPGMAGIAREIAEDRATLEAVMERAGRPAMTTRTGAPDPVGQLRALEMLSLGVEGKSCRWEGLRRLSATVPALLGTDDDALLSRARGQRTWREGQRLAATGRVGAAADVGRV
ncbi:MAG: hypothetical protein AB7O78_17620 [Thermoleophilia bacterium]